MQSIDSLSFTLTAFDGDTAVGNFDFNNLSLGLDGINTGILLNGFGNEITVTQTLMGTPPGMASAILAALQDGLLNPSVFRGNGTFGNFVSFDNVTATLSITGSEVPEPATMTLLAIGGIAGLGAFRRRNRVRSATV